MGQNGPKWAQMGPNGPKWAQICLNGTKMQKIGQWAQKMQRNAKENAKKCEIMQKMLKNAKNWPMGPQNAKEC